MGWLAVYIHRMRPRQPWHHGKHTRSVKCAYYIQTHTRTHPQVVAEVEGARGLHPRQHALPPLRLPRRRRRVRVRVCVCGLIGNASMRERERETGHAAGSSQARQGMHPSPLPTRDGTIDDPFKPHTHTNLPASPPPPPPAPRRRCSSSPPPPSVVSTPPPPLRAAATVPPGSGARSPSRRARPRRGAA